MNRVVAYGVCAAVLAAVSTVAGAQARPPNFVPPNWITEQPNGRNDVIHYLSPDRHAVLTLRDVRKDETISEQMAAMSDRAGGTITYRRLARRWFVISGVRGDQIFYIRADAACGGTRWHVVELTYPRAEKRRWDSAVKRASFALREYRRVCPRS